MTCCSLVASHLASHFTPSLFPSDFLQISIKISIKISINFHQFPSNFHHMSSSWSPSCEKFRDVFHSFLGLIVSEIWHFAQFLQFSAKMKHVTANLMKCKIDQLHARNRFLHLLYFYIAGRLRYGHFAHILRFSAKVQHAICKTDVHAPSSNEDLSIATFISEIGWKMAEKSPMEIQSINQASKQASKQSRHKFPSNNNGSMHRFACFAKLR